MKVALFFIFLFSIATANVHPHPDPIITHVPKEYHVNIDQDPLTRWAPIIKDFEQPIKNFMTFFFDLLPFPKTFFREVEWYAKNQFKYKDFVAEVNAISILSGYPFEKMFFVNFMYEFSTTKACTGVVMRTEEGRIIHGRNLDFPMWGLLANLTATVHYYRGDKFLFTVDSVIPSVFTLTALKPGAFSIEVNTRTQSNFDDDFINVLVKNAIPTCWLVRKVVEEETTYSGAVARLKSQRIGGTVYFIVSGTKGNEGSVIQRDNDKVHAFYELNETTWFLVQTNYDRNVPDPVADQRRLPAEAKLQKRGNKNFNEQDLFDVILSQYPNLQLLTIQTVVMRVDTGYHNTTSWYGSNPVSIRPNLLVE